MLRLSLFLFTCMLFFSACVVDPPEPPGTTDLVAIPYEPIGYTVISPKGLPTMEIPADNPMTEQGIKLGRHLFYDPILSRDSTISCASCHQWKYAFADKNGLALGIKGRRGTRSSMSLLNIGYNQSLGQQHNFMWDGRFQTLEEQALEPIEAFAEMDNTWENVLVKLKAHPNYPTLFREAFGIKGTSDITKELAAKAIAQFERTLNSAGSEYDRSEHQSGVFLSEEAQNGQELFLGDENPGSLSKDAECAHCHGVSRGKQMFSIAGFSNNGLDSVGSFNDFIDNGFGAVSTRFQDNGSFKQVTLRNIALTAPYMHDGRLQTLHDVVNFYVSGRKDIIHDKILHLALDLPTLNTKEVDDIVTFLHTLTDTSYYNKEEWKSPF
jgi:cytochrome c peroxidase